MIRIVLSLMCCLAAHAAQAADEPPAAPEILSMDQARYPAEDLLPGIEASVELDMQVSAAGSVDGVRVARTSGYPPLDKAAVDAARTAKFRPMLDRDGKPQAVRVSLPYSFARSMLALQRPCVGFNNEITEFLRFNPGKPRDQVQSVSTIRGLLMAGVVNRKDAPLDLAAVNRVSAVVDAVIEECRAHPDMELPKAIKAASAKVK